MSRGGAPPSYPISTSSLSDLFPPSPTTSTLRETMFARPLESGIKFTIRPSTPAQPYPLTPLSAPVPLNTTGPASSHVQHPRLVQATASGELATRRAQGLTLPQIKSAAKGRLRAIECSWKDDGCSTGCDAVLASWELYQKHLKRHYEREAVASRGRDEPGEIFRNLRCGWKGCDRVFPFRAADLIKHVESTHLREVKETWCPFSTCSYEKIDKATYHDPAHYLDFDHPRPWSTQSLYAHPDPREHDLRTPQPALPPLPETCTIHSFLCEAQPYRATPPAKRKRGGRGRSPWKGTPEPLSYLADIKDGNVSIRELIVPMHRDHDYVPVSAFDLPSGAHTAQALSSSFFPFPAVHSRRGDMSYSDTAVTLPNANGQKVEVDLWTIMRDEKTPEEEIPYGVSPMDDLVPPGEANPARKSDQRDQRDKRRKIESDFIPRPRAKTQRGFNRQPYDGVTCIKLSQEQREREKEQKERDRPKRLRAEFGTGENGEELGVEDMPVEGERVWRASKRRARRLVGYSFGFRNWEEKVAFEQTGVRLGEIDCRVSK